MPKTVVSIWYQNTVQELDGYTHIKGALFRMGCTGLSNLTQKRTLTLAVGMLQIDPEATINGSFGFAQGQEWNRRYERVGLLDIMPI